MAHLYYVDLKDKEGVGGLINTEPFTHLMPTYYWSGTTFPAYQPAAWWFAMYTGSQYPDVKTDEINAMAIRPGIVEFSSVPEPSTFLLLGAGLGGLVFWKNRKS